MLWDVTRSNGEVTEWSQDVTEVTRFFGDVTAL